MKSTRVLIVAGGSGGHIYPALALAHALCADGVEVAWLGSRVGLEERIVKNHPEIDYHSISMARIRGKGLVRWLLLPYILAYGVWQALGVLKRTKAQTVVCFGGFVTVPAGLAAWTYSIPLIVHEQNAIAGLSNRLLSRLTPHLFTSFANTRYVPQGTVIGNPVRESIRNVPAVIDRFSARTGAICIAVLGGSQGAQALNQQVPPIVAALNRPLKVWHQGGRTAIASYGTGQIDAQLDAFIEDMSRVYEWADLIVARAGAMTVSELGACGLGAILIPFPFAVDDHQNANADAFVACGGGYKIAQQRLAEQLPNCLHQLLDGTDEQARTRLQALALRAHSFSQAYRVDAATVLSTQCQTLCQAQQQRSA